ncbi:HNH endonuclease [Lysinibacillus sp.]|uniref:HNH endonuclease n=1 Tax=Lysinibacillus sp. TaxID=1869345 RepID=UPI0028AA722B|nr:HNH endonuclease [Lysinibacillus sp.]
MKPQRKCKHATCRTLIDYDQQHCEAHKPKSLWKQESYAARMEKDEQYRRFYASKAWRNLSFQHRLKHPLCEDCLKLGIAVKADVADHVIEIKDDWSKRLDESNIISRCHHHHAIKTKQEQKKRSLP